MAGAVVAHVVVLAVARQGLAVGLSPASVTRAHTLLQVARAVAVAEVEGQAQGLRTVRARVSLLTHTLVVDTRALSVAVARALGLAALARLQLTELAAVGHRAHACAVVAYAAVHTILGYTSNLLLTGEVLTRCPHVPWLALAHRLPRGAVGVACAVHTLRASEHVACEAGEALLALTTLVFARAVSAALGAIGGGGAQGSGAVHPPPHGTPPVGELSLALAHAVHTDAMGAALPRAQGTGAGLNAAVCPKASVQAVAGAPAGAETHGAAIVGTGGQLAVLSCGARPTEALAANTNASATAIPRAQRQGAVHALPIRAAGTDAVLAACAMPRAVAGTEHRGAVCAFVAAVAHTAGADVTDATPAAVARAGVRRSGFALLLLSHQLQVLRVQISTGRWQVALSTTASPVNTGAMAATVGAGLAQPSVAVHSHVRRVARTHTVVAHASAAAVVLARFHRTVQRCEVALLAVARAVHTQTVGEATTLLVERKGAHLGLATGALPSHLALAMGRPSSYISHTAAVSTGAVAARDGAVRTHVVGITLAVKGREPLQTLPPP